MATKMYKKNRFVGCFTGAAIGDAMGSDVKGMAEEEIKKTFGKKGLLQPGKVKNQPTSKPSDETQLALFTASGLIKADELGAAKDKADYTEYVYYALQQWLYTQTGSTATEDLEWVTNEESDLLSNTKLFKKRMPTKQLLTALADSDEKSYGTIKKPKNECKLFDCLPYALPCGLYFYKDNEVAFERACDLAAITHGDPSAYYSAGAFAAIISAICQKQTIEVATQSAIEILNKHEEAESVATYLSKALQLLDEKNSIRSDMESLGKGNTAESALALGVYCACLHYEYDDSIRLAVNRSKNPDITAFVAGALNGAYFGDNCIPKKWRKKVEFLEVTDDYASRLLAVAPKKL